MRKIAILGFGGLVASSFGQAGYLGTKVSGTTQSGPTGSNGMWALFQMLLALGIVIFLLRWALPKAAQFFTKTQSKSSLIKLEESLQVAGGSLHLVTVKDRVFFIGLSPQSIQLLAEFGDTPAPIDPFEQVLATAEPCGPESLEALRQLERLTQLTGDHEVR